MRRLGCLPDIPGEPPLHLESRKTRKRPGVEETEEPSWPARNMALVSQTVAESKLSRVR